MNWFYSQPRQRRRSPQPTQAATWAPCAPGISSFKSSEPRPPNLDRNAFWQSGQPPSWADKNGWGTDEYGHWVTFSVENKQGQKITQRMRWIEPGTFLMGSPENEPERLDDEGPQHSVTIGRGFWLFDTACTQALWEAVMGENPSRFKGADRPVENVSWNDCQDFLQRLNERLPGLDLALPSEAQWEYACRAGTTTPFSFGANITPEQVNYNGDYPYAGGKKGLYRQRDRAGGEPAAEPVGPVRDARQRLGVVPRPLARQLPGRTDRWLGLGGQLTPARSVSCAAGPGTTARASCERRTASRATPTAATTASAFAVPEFRS